MEQNRWSQAAELLAGCRYGGPRLPRLPEDLRPADQSEAYDLQDALHERLAAGTRERAGLGAIAGYKIGCTTPVMQRFLDIHNPCAGAVFESTVQHGGGRFRRGDYHRVGVECEIAVRLGRGLAAADAPFDRAAVAPAVEAVMAAVEVVDERFEDFRQVDAPSLIADDFFNAGAVLGPPVTDWQGLDLAAIRGTMRIDGREVGEGRGRDILGHPLEALAWLTNLMASRGRDLPAGAFVLLGSVVETAWPQPGQTVEVTLSDLGSLSLLFE